MPLRLASVLLAMTLSQQVFASSAPRWLRETTLSTDGGSHLLQSESSQKEVPISSNPTNDGMIQKINAYVKANRKSMFWSALIQMIFLCCVAYFYRGARHAPSCEPALVEQSQDFSSWRFGLFSCFEDWQTCLCACCCSAIRWSDTISLVPGFVTFWTAFVVFIVLQYAESLLVMFSSSNVFTLVFGLLLWGVLVYSRYQLRVRFGMEHGTCGIYIQDCLTYLCCWCCAVAQEARHVEDAIRHGHPAVKNA